ncbi:MFS transporter [Cupriavidus necator]|uniref:MFS transporter n=1 Tax=Cupriavidus necator TaxID=106590 RepID=A0A1U9V1B6_CUPNE|nr:MFS transporter [Cupriavidus necator]AQV98271.1 MFS transporter [Cupriavidus necator]
MATDSNDYQFKPHERPTIPGSPATPEHPAARRIAYFFIGFQICLTSGFGNALVVANTTNLQGVFGLYSDEVVWLSTVYVMTNVCASLLLIKFRQQYGLENFTRVVLLSYVAITGAHLLTHTFGTALMVRAANGLAASGLSTLGLYYFIQSLPAAHRVRAVVLGISVPQLATPLARTFSTGMLEAGNWRTLYLFELGMALLSLAAVSLLRLPPSERIQAFEKLDFLTVGLFAPGMALLCAVLSQGRFVWWIEAPWIGYGLCAALLLITAALWVEHNRANPLLNTRWLGSWAILRFGIVAMSVRVLLSEQPYGAVGLLTAVGMNNDQLIYLYTVVSMATAAGIGLSVATVNPQNLVRPIRISLVLIAAAAFLDASATNLTRPANLYFTQSLIAFATVYFMGPTLLIGMSSALARGMSHLVSFSALFSITQSLGGLVGTALLGTFQIYREKFHSHELVQSISLSDPLDAARIQALGAAYQRVLGDGTLRQAEGVALLAQQVTREANILAYNDVFLLIGVLSTMTLAWLVTLYLRKIRAPGQAGKQVPPAGTPTEQRE